jgi:DNA-binding MarR family transcriptional regulator
MAGAQDRRIRRVATPRKEALSETEYQTLAEFRYMLRRFLNRSAAAARSANLTPHQHQALLAIRGYGGGSISIGELAEKLMVKHHSAGELVERLLQAGLVERRADSADRLLATLSTIHLEELRLIQPSLQRLLAKLEDR